MSTVRDCKLPAIQYMRPDGRKVPRTFLVTKDYWDKGQKFIAAGGFFSAEVLTTGQVVLYAEHKDSGDADVAMEICANGPEVSQAVEKVIDTAMAWLAKKSNIIDNPKE